MEYVLLSLLVVVAALCVAVLVKLSAKADNSVSEKLSALNESVQRQDERLDRRLDSMDQKLDRRLNDMDGKIDKRIGDMLASNEKKLDEMRFTVDEKLNKTLETRLNASFESVSKRLEQVYKGLGEMQTLASGVGDLKKVLTNVKTRGTWGEIQLGALLEQMLTPAQYAANIAVVPGSADRVEYALIIPAKDDDGKKVYIPIDSKFPVEDYQRLLDAQDACEKDAVDAAYAALERALKTQAKKIHDKYIHVPDTTDFAIMFLPTEGLFAEALRINGLCETLQRDLHITITGPTTLSAFLSSLQMGFRTLNIEKRSAEVWNILGAIKTEFGKFADLLDATQKKLGAAERELENAARKTRTITSKLKKVEAVEDVKSAFPELLDADASEE